MTNKTKDEVTFNCFYQGKTIQQTGINEHHVRTRAAWHFMLPPAQIHLIDVWRAEPSTKDGDLAK
jgi:hypothetical protein